MVVEMTRERGAHGTVMQWTTDDRPTPQPPRRRKNIRLTSRPGEVECNTRKVKGLVLRTEFLKKA